MLWLALFFFFFDIGPLGRDGAEKSIFWPALTGRAIGTLCCFAAFRQRNKLYHTRNHTTLLFDFMRKGYARKQNKAEVITNTQRNQISL